MQLHPISLLGIGLLLISSIKSSENLQICFSPWAPIKTSFGKVAAFYPSLSQCVFSRSLSLALSLFATSLNKLREKKAVKAGY